MTYDYETLRKHGTKIDVYFGIDVLITGSTIFATETAAAVWMLVNVSSSR
jgi:hypothetical protein